MLGAPANSTNKFRTWGRGAAWAALLGLWTTAPCWAASPAGTPAASASRTSPAVPVVTASPTPAKSPASTPAPAKRPAGKSLAPKLAPPSTMSADQYMAELRAASAAMLKMEPHPPRPLGDLLQPLAAPVRVTRADGAKLTCSGDEWNAIISNDNLGPGSGVATRDEVEATRDQVEASLAEVKAWAAPAAGHYYRAAGAGKIFATITASGQIRTGPDWLQSAVNRTLKAISDAWTSFANWLQSLFPSRPATAPRWNLSWLPAFMWTFLIGVLACLIVVLWISLGGRWDRVRRRRAESQIAAGGDAELMLLPPDELHRRALDYAASGNFREALRHRYLSLLLVLDACGVWRYDTRRTNWEHIGKLRGQPGRAPLLSPLADITRRFDHVRYGGAACDAEAWARFAHDTDRLEASAGAPARAATGVTA